MRIYNVKTYVSWEWGVQELYQLACAVCTEYLDAIKCRQNA